MIHSFIEVFKSLGFNDAFLICVGSIVFIIVSVMLGNVSKSISSFNDITIRLPIPNDLVIKLPFVKKSTLLLKKRINPLFAFANFIFWIGCTMLGLSITIVLYHILALTLPVVFG
jgi:hypothetical protein